MEIPELLLLVMETSLVSLCMKIMSVLITVILYGRMIEIYLYCSVSPIPFATMTNREWGQIGNNYLKSLFAIGFQGFLIMICVGIYAVMVNSMIIADNLHSVIFSLAAYTVILCFSLLQIRRTGEVDILRISGVSTQIRPDLDADNPHIIRAGKGHRLTFALITLMENYSNTKPRERFSLGVCTRTQRLIQSQDKSSFQPYQTADCMFCGGSPVRLAAFLSAQRQHRHKPCVYGYDCRHAALFPLCHV